MKRITLLLTLCIGTLRVSAQYITTTNISPVTSNPKQAAKAAQKEKKDLSKKSQTKIIKRTKLIAKYASDIANKLDAYAKAINDNSLIILADQTKTAAQSANDAAKAVKDPSTAATAATAAQTAADLSQNAADALQIHDTLKCDLTGAGVSNLAGINSTTAALGLNFYNYNRNIFINLGYNLSGTNLLKNGVNTLSYLFFPDVSRSSGSLNIHYFPYGESVSNSFGMNLIADMNGQNLTNKDSNTFSVATYNLAFGFEYVHNETGKNPIKITVGGNLNIIGVNSDSLTNQNLDLLGLKNNNVLKNGYILGSNWYALVTINQQTTIFFRLYNSWGRPGFNKQFGAVLFSFGVTVSADVIHIN